MEVDFTALAAEVEAEDGLSDLKADRVCTAIAELRPDIGVTPKDLRSTDRLLHLTDEVAPGWDIHLRGKAIEPDGHWSCTLRRSDSRDSDEFIGSGRGRTLSSAILAATFRTLGYQLRQRQLE